MEAYWAETLALAITVDEGCIVTEHINQHLRRKNLEKLFYQEKEETYHDVDSYRCPVPIHLGLHQ